jgi:protein-S-isoprenylcysteine O-methyltransferase Ste14
MQGREACRVGHHRHDVELGHHDDELAVVTDGDGIYRTIRNPSYLGLLLLSLGWALAFRSMAGVLLVVLMLIPLVARIRSEEALLRSQFGARYDDYCARTWRLIPGVLAHTARNARDSLSSVARFS